jgi:hypothetical protein
MSDDTQDLTASQPSLDELLAQIVAAEEAGQPADAQSLAAKYPQHAADLREFIANRNRMQRMAAPLREVAGAAGSSGDGSPRGMIRYFGDYELLDEIAAGGMGIVYKARQVSLNRLVAVKMILRGTLATAEDVQRFRAEAEAAASLQHPGIVAIHEVGLHEGQHYFSMDYVDGQSLAGLPREQPLSPRQAAEYERLDRRRAIDNGHRRREWSRRKAARWAADRTAACEKRLAKLKAEMALAAASLARWCRKQGVTAVDYDRTPRGFLDTFPYRALLDRITTALENAGIALHVLGDEQDKSQVAFAGPGSETGDMA